MPLTDDGLRARDREEILSARIADIRDAYEDPAASEGDLIWAILYALSAATAQQQEADLADLYENAFLTSATGNELSKKVREYGLSRNQATGATGIATFARTSQPTGTYTIPSGYEIQTRGTDPVSFETTQAGALALLEDWESGSLPASYSGDTGNASVQSSTVLSGSYSLELDATSGTTIYSTEDPDTTRRGVRLETDIQLPTNGVGNLLFHVDTGTGQDYYQARVDANNDELAIERSDGGTTTTLSSTSVSVPTGATSVLHLVAEQTVTGTVRATLYDTSNAEIAQAESTDETTYTSGAIGFGSGDANGAKYFDTVTRTRVATNIAATEGGAQTNIAPNRITSFVSPIAGVDAVTNPVGTGDDSYDDLNGVSFRRGVDRETDDELRERALQSNSIGGAATVGAVKTALLDELPRVQSVNVLQNQTSSSNANGNSLPAYSMEPIVDGGTTEDVVAVLEDTLAVTNLARTVGGVNGTKETGTVTSDILDQDITIEITRPSDVVLEITLDIVVDDTYVGDTDIKDSIIEYVGGKRTDGSIANGLPAQQDVRVDKIRDIVHGADNGVRGFDSSATTDGIIIDDNTDGSDDTTNNTNNLRVYAVSNTESATVDAADITVNTTTV